MSMLMSLFLLKLERAKELSPPEVIDNITSSCLRIKALTRTSVSSQH